LTRINPRAVPIQTFDSRSAIIAVATATLTRGSSPLALIAAPSQRTTPLPVAIQTSPVGETKKAVFLGAHPKGAVSGFADGKNR
jgi:hypothetical protein